MLNLNPLVSCPECGLTAKLSEATRFGLLCPRCQKEFRYSGGQEAVASPTVSVHETLSGRHESFVCAELILPSQNIRDVPEVVSFLSSLPRPVSLEFRGTFQQPSILLRGPNNVLDSLSSSIPMHWPGAFLRSMPAQENGLPQIPNSSPYGVWLSLEKDPFLPLRVWETFLRGDPVHSLLSAFQGLEQSHGLWLQIFLPSFKGEPPWLAKIRERLKLESQRGYQVQGALGESYAVPTPAAISPGATNTGNLMRGGAFLFCLLALLVVIGAGLISTSNLIWAIPVGLLLLGLFFFIATRDTREEDWSQTDLEVVREKISQYPILPVSIRLIAWAASPAEGGALLRRVLSVLDQYGRAHGNSFSVHKGQDAYPDPVWPEEIPLRPVCWMGPDELAGLWHIPVVTEQVALPMMPVNASEWRAPLPSEVSGSNPIGDSCSPDNRIQVPVSLSSAAQRSGIFLLGKTRMGKSTLLERMFDLAMRDPRRPAVVVTDPHGDMANHVLGMVPPDRLDDVVFWDVLDQEFALGMNPLDMFLPGNTIQDAVQLMIDVGESLWTDYWGHRMRIPLQRALTALAAANTRRAPDQQLGPSALSFLLNAKPEVRNEFLRNEVKGTPVEREVLDYFLGEFENLQTPLRQQIIQPVTSKAHRFEEEPALWLFSPSQSTISLSDVLNKRKILILSTHQLKLGDDLAGFIGALVLNFVIRALGEQEQLPPEERTTLYMLADEFQAIPSVRWEVFLQQMAKLGGIPALGTQSLASLRKFDPFLPSIIFSGVQTIVSFQVNGEDAEELERREFARKAGGPGMESLMNLKPHQAWIRTINESRAPLPPFRVNMRTPIVPDESVRAQILSMRRNYALSCDDARNQATSTLRNWMLSYAGSSVRSDGGGAEVTLRSKPDASPVEAQVPVYADRPTPLTADLPEGLHDIISAPGNHKRRPATSIPCIPAKPDEAFVKAAESDLHLASSEV